MMASMRSDELSAVQRESAYLIADLQKLLSSCTLAEFPSLEQGGFLKPPSPSGGSSVDCRRHRRTIAHQPTSPIGAT